MTYFNATGSGWKPLITILWAIYHYMYHLAYDNKYINEWCYWQNLCSVPGLWFVENVSVWSFLFCWMDQTLTLIIYLFIYFVSIYLMPFKDGYSFTTSSWFFAWFASISDKNLKSDWTNTCHFKNLHFFFFFNKEQFIRHKT